MMPTSPAQALRLAKLLVGLKRPYGADGVDAQVEGWERVKTGPAWIREHAVFAIESGLEIP